MKKISQISAGLMLACSLPAGAGGLLTNTNQNIAFLRNPARDAALSIDGIYSNPAGVAFLDDGFHLSLNWQNAHQTRTIHTAYEDWFSRNLNEPAPVGADGYALRRFKGTADAPVLPSVQAAYNQGRWSLQFGFAVSGGGGKCAFDDGLGSFEGIMVRMAKQLNDANPALGLNGYSFDSYLRGRQYYFGVTLGAAYKVTERLSVYAGGRVLYGNANYSGYLRNMKLAGAATGGHAVDAPVLLGQLKDQAAAAAQQYAQLGMADQAAQYTTMARTLAGYELATQGIDLQCDQTGWGVAPVLGIDYRAGRLNVAAKLDFKVRMRLESENPSAAFNTIAAAQPMLQKFQDGAKVAEDSPAMLTVGAQYDITPAWRVMAGWHHFFDQDCKQYTKADLGDTNEWNVGTEYDVNSWLQVSTGFQKTNYDIEPGFMQDIAFNVSSYSFGFGVGVKVSDRVKLNAAYFQTNYDKRRVASEVSGISVLNNYTRTNRVLGIGCDIDF